IARRVRSRQNRQRKRRVSKKARQPAPSAEQVDFSAPSLWTLIRSGSSPHPVRKLQEPSAHLDGRQMRLLTVAEYDQFRQLFDPYATIIRAKRVRFSVVAKTWLRGRGGTPHVESGSKSIVPDAVWKGR